MYGKKKFSSVNSIYCFDQKEVNHPDVVGMDVSWLYFNKVFGIIGRSGPVFVLPNIWFRQNFNNDGNHNIVVIAAIR
jgi:hypothetical protein